MPSWFLGLHSTQRRVDMKYHMKRYFEEPQKVRRMRRAMLDPRYRRIFEKQWGRGSFDVRRTREEYFLAMARRHDRIPALSPLRHLPPEEAQEDIRNTSSHLSLFNRQQRPLFRHYDNKKLLPAFTLSVNEKTMSPRTPHQLKHHLLTRNTSTEQSNFRHVPFQR